MQCHVSFFNSVTKRDKIQPVSERREDQVYKCLVCLRSTKHSQSTVVWPQREKSALLYLTLPQLLNYFGLKKIQIVPKRWQFSNFTAIIYIKKAQAACMILSYCSPISRSYRLCEIVVISPNLLIMCQKLRVRKVTIELPNYLIIVCSIFSIILRRDFELNLKSL